MSMLVSKIILFFIIYLVYHLSLYYSIPGGDSGELAAESCNLGIAHPPGYPLFILLYHYIPSLIPITRFYLNNNFNDNTYNIVIDWEPTIAWKMNHLSCIISALTAVMIASTIQEIIIVQNQINVKNNIQSSSSLLAVCVPSILFAFAPVVWEYAITAEVFALNNFLCSCMIFLTTKIILSFKENNYITKYLLFGAFISGLCFTNQHSSALLLAVAIPWVLYEWILIKKPSEYCHYTWIILSISFIIGSFGYIYMGILATPKRGSWGNMSTIPGIFKHILRQEYGTFQLGALKAADDTETSFMRVILHVYHFCYECYYILPLLIIAGVYYLLYDTQSSSTRKNIITKQKKNQKKKSNCNMNNKEKADSSPTDETSLSSSTTITNSSSSSRPTTTTMNDALEKLASSSLRRCGLFYIAAYLFYTIIWHGMLSNLPLTNPVAYGVHSRFWQQPLILLCILSGSGILYIVNKFKISFYLQSIFTIVVTAIMLMNFNEFDRSQVGGTLHLFAQNTLDTISHGGALIAHTDLTWNPIRYLQHCESKRLDVAHVNFQMMPYPWFKEVQAPLYPTLKFPDTFDGVSTNRNENGNAMLIMKFIRSNADMIMKSTYNYKDGDLIKVLKEKNNIQMKDGAGVYIDMQSIAEVEIENVGQWRGLTLVPWGVNYRVEPGIGVEDANPNSNDKGTFRFKELIRTSHYHRDAIAALRHVESTFTTLNNDTKMKMNHVFYDKFHPGSWEWGAVSLTNDAKYQLALFLLTFSIELQTSGLDSNASLMMMPLLLDRLYTAALLLEETLNNVEITSKFISHHKYVAAGPFGINAEASNRKTQVPITISLKDLMKNTAVAWLRLVGVHGVVVQVEESFKESLKQQISNEKNITIDSSSKIYLIDSNRMKKILKNESSRSIRERAKKAMFKFVQAYPDDNDAATFKANAEKLN